MNFIDVRESHPDEDQIVWVKTVEFDVKPIRAYYLDGAFWPMDLSLDFPLKVTHYRLLKDDEAIHFRKAFHKIKLECQDCHACADILAKEINNLDYLNAARKMAGCKCQELNLQFLFPIDSIRGKIFAE